MSAAALTGTCHCGAVTYRLAIRPTQIVKCNCSACRRYRALWAHMPLEQVNVNGQTTTYSHGDKQLAFHSCRICGATTHWTPLKPQQGTPSMAVNLAMAAPDEIADIPVRHFDGAESWRFLD